MIIGGCGRPPRGSNLQQLELTFRKPWAPLLRRQSCCSADPSGRLPEPILLHTGEVPERRIRCSDQRLRRKWDQRFESPFLQRRVGCELRSGWSFALMRQRRHRRRPPRLLRSDAGSIVEGHEIAAAHGALHAFSVSKAVIAAEAGRRETARPYRLGSCGAVTSRICGRGA